MIKFLCFNLRISECEGHREGNSKLLSRKNKTKHGVELINLFRTGQTTVFHDVTDLIPLMSFPNHPHYTPRVIQELGTWKASRETFICSSVCSFIPPFIPSYIAPATLVGQLPSLTRCLPHQSWKCLPFPCCYYLSSDLNRLNGCLHDIYFPKDISK